MVAGGSACLWCARAGRCADARRGARLGLRDHARARRRPPPSTTARATRCRAASGQFTLDQIRNRMGPADWYPGDHPEHAADRRHGPRGRGRLGVLPVPLSERQGAPRERERRRPAEGLLHSADVRLQERPARQRRAAQAEHTADDGLRGRDDGRRNSRGRRVLQLDALDAVDRGRRDGHRAEDARRRAACT